MVMFLFYFFFYCCGDHRDLHSFPTRRSSDLLQRDRVLSLDELAGTQARDVVAEGRRRSSEEDRKSTRLNSSHGYISYAVFCLKKKKSTTSVGRSMSVRPTRPTYCYGSAVHFL